MIGLACPIQRRKKGYGGTGGGGNEAVSGVTASRFRGDYAKHGVISRLKGEEDLYDSKTGCGEAGNSGDFRDSI